MKKLLFGTEAQAREFAEQNEIKITGIYSVNLSGFEGQEGAPESFSGETNALVSEDYYLAYWE